MDHLTLIYARAHGVGSWLLRAGQWWAPWSHVGLVDEYAGCVLEARAFHGVVETGLSAFVRRYSRIERVIVPCPEPALGLRWARSQLGAPYDYGAVARFVSTALGADSRAAYHCVEFAERAIEVAGRPRFRVPAHRVTVRQSYITR